MRPGPGLLAERLAGGDVLVSDGAMGTQLFAWGLKVGACTEAWNLERPELLEKVARLYAEAGADIVHTNSFGANPITLAGYGLQDRCEEINLAAVSLARAGAGEGVIVSASIGPTGRTLLPLGDLEPERAAEAYRRQAAAMAEGGVDAFSVETMTDLNEARLAVEACREVAPQLPVMATMTFDRAHRGWLTIMGVDPAEAAAGLAEAGADVVGSNCGNGAEAMVEVARALREATDLPLLIQPNAGLPVLEKGVMVYRETPEFMAGHARRLLDLGVGIIGGCCGTTPAHIRALRDLVDGGSR